MENYLFWGRDGKRSPDILQALLSVQLGLDLCGPDTYEQVFNQPGIQPFCNRCGNQRGMIVPSIIPPRPVKRNGDDDVNCVIELGTPDDEVCERGAQKPSHVFAPSKLEPMDRLSKRPRKDRQRSGHNKRRLLLTARRTEAFMLNWIPTVVTKRRRNRFESCQALRAQGVHVGMPATRTSRRVDEVDQRTQHG